MKSLMFGAVLLAISLLAGCGGSVPSKVSGPAPDPAPAPKKTSIIGKTTQDIQKFDPNANQEVSDSKVKVSASPTYAMEAYRPAMEQIVKLQIDQSVRIFEALNGRYPKNYDEFMEEIIKKNNVRLPVLPGGWKYAYDETNHTIEVVKATGEAAEPSDGAPKDSGKK